MEFLKIIKVEVNNINCLTGIPTTFRNVNQGAVVEVTLTWPKDMDLRAINPVVKITREAKWVDGVSISGEILVQAIGPDSLRK